MPEAVADFIKDAGLCTLAHLLLTAIAILSGVALFFLARTRKQMSFFLLVGILPAVSGILAMYFTNKYSTPGMFDPPGPKEIAAAHRDAWIDLTVGLASAGVILLLRDWRRRMNAKRDG
jgi:uncharacterized membrane-anchored protein